VQKGLKFFAEAGIWCPSASVMQELVSRIKNSVFDLSKEDLEINRKEHVAACCQGLNYVGDIKWTDGNGKEHSVARGAVTTDGAGEMRAYSHHITGSQHCLVIFSLVTNKPIYVHNDQISCKRCSLAFTRSMEKAKAMGKPIHDPSLFSTKHSGKCYKNKNHNPASAEEWACKQAGNFLLRCVDGKDILPDDEAIFANQFITDGDTRGAKKFIARQVELIGNAAEGIAEHFPDFGHFIKCISGALYNLCEKDSSFKGVGLLDSSRIKAMSSDITHNIRNLHERLEGDQDISELRTKTMRSCMNNKEYNDCGAVNTAVL
jgi:hypothetical protein